MEQPLVLDVFDEKAFEPREPCRAPGEFRAGRRPELGAAGLAVLEQLAAGVFLLDKYDRVVHLNGTAKQIIDARDGVDLRDGCLTATVPASRPLLRSIIECPLGGSAAVQRTSGTSPYIVVVIANRGTGDSAAPASGAKTVFITDPVAPIEEEHEAAMRQIWGLTRAEARVACALLAGLTPGEIAARTGVSRNTVRIQMYAIFSKVGVRRQAELVRILATLTAFSAVTP